ncbi:MAG: DUF2301 domain-containing membrane protein [Spirochaetia bacterium]|nr:DUF2301 domain-containing membrane protein [Spirochaetia bacterium]
MGEKKIKQPLTMYDKFSVFFYRMGIVISAMCILYAVYYFYLNTYDKILPKYFYGAYAIIVFWIFVISVSTSVTFLHLYSKKVLNIIRAFSVIGALTLILLAVSGNLDYLALFESNGWRGKIGVIGLGFVLAGFSGIGAKEAFCFKLNEGYAYGIGLAILVILHLLGLLSPHFGFMFSTFIGGLVLIFTIRKLFLPLHYDIGDKSRY